jgi:SH3 domain protein
MKETTMRKRIVASVLLLFALPVNAETVYVTERLPTALRTAFAEGSPVVKTIEGGAQLEVLERAERFARVRDAQGAEGWIEARWLVNAPPARPQLDRSQAELAKLRTELNAAQARIGQLETKLSQETARGVELAQTAEQVRAEADAAAANSAPAASIPAGNDTDFSWGWLVLAFAMLWLGFGAGVVWLRERNRKRLGGMYLRI